MCVCDCDTTHGRRDARWWLSGLSLKATRGGRLGGGIGQCGCLECIAPVASITCWAMHESRLGEKAAAAHVLVD